MALYDFDRMRAPPPIGQAHPAETVPDIVYRYQLQPERACLYISASVTQLTGYPPEDYYADPDLALKIIHPDDRVRLEELYEGRIPEGGVVLRYLTREGKTLWIEQRDTLVRDEHGVVVALDGIARDVGAEVASRRRLEEHLHRQASVIDNVADAILTTDTEYRIATWNRAAEQIYGWTAAEVIGRHAREVLKTEVSPDEAAAWRAAVDSGAHWEGQVTQHHRDGKPIPIFSSVTGVRDSQGAQIGLVAVNRDATEMQRMQTELRQAQKMEALGRMAASVAHDFNNLLMGMNGAADIMLHQLPEHSLLRTYATELKRLAQSGSQMTHQLLDIASDRQSEAGILLDESIASLRITLGRLLGERIRLEVRLGAPGSPVALDLGSVGQILLNLAANARDAMPGGGRFRVQTVPGSGRTDGDWVELTISDDGPGIDAETLEHIFEPFFTTKEPGKGTGLGLASVYAVVRRAGGSVEVNSAPGHGTTFHIGLPVRAMRDTPPPPPRAKAPEARQILAQPGTILVAEDNATTRLALQDLLEEAGFQVMAAATAAEALLLCEQVGIPDVLAVNLRLPDFPGDVLISSVREMRADMPVVLMSGRRADDPQVHALCAKPGVCFLQKPFDVDDLIACVHDLRARS